MAAKEWSEAEEIEITSEMIEAGWNIISKHWIEFIECPALSREIFSDACMAALKARPLFRS